MIPKAPPGKIVVLGGGTAGWMAANLIAHRWKAASVVVIESPDIGIIGVGEGSTPQLKAFFDHLGIAESDWMPRCNATYKNGIRFKGWSERAGFGSYFHPFPTGVDVHTLPQFCYNSRARRTGRDVLAHPDHFFLPTYLADRQLAPVAPESFPFRMGYGYHFDAHLVGAFLRDHAVGQGVVHLKNRVAAVALDDQGNVASLACDDGAEIRADLFVDCSGFGSMILQQALGEPFVSFAENLFNDRAVVMPTPADGLATRAHTTATALSAGWAWDIPLTNRTGNGYVYSSGFISADAAETELRSHLGLLDSPVAARHLNMKVGRVARSWVGNVLAVGLSQGFIEPLEATALHIVQTTVEQFLEGWESSSCDAFNKKIAARFDGIRDYIVCHYRMNQRTSSAYWLENGSNQKLSDSLKAIVTCWFTGADLAAEIADQKIGQFYESLSWHCLLAGYGTFPADANMSSADESIEKIDIAKIEDFIRRCGLNFTDHRSMLGMLASRPVAAAQNEHPRSTHAASLDR
jgi:tryptophan 6-halogenase